MSRSLLPKVAICVLLSQAAVPALAGVDIVNVVNQIRSHYALYDKEVFDLSLAVKVMTPEGEWIEKKMFAKGPLMRVDTTAPTAELLSDPEAMAALRTTLVYDGRQAWLVRAFSDPERVDIGEFVETPIFGHWWKLLTSRAMVEDEARLDDSDTFVIAPEPQTGSWYSRLWIEKDTWLLLKAEGVSGTGARHVWRFRDHRPVTEGYRLPYQIDHYENDVLIKSYTVTSVTVNHSLPDHIFKVPADLTKAALSA